MKHIVTLEDLELLGVSTEHAECWMESRGKNKLTTVALKRIQREAESIGWTLPRAVTYAAEMGWTGFKAAWIKQETQEVGFIEKHTNKDWRQGLQ